MKIQVKSVSVLIILCSNELGCMPKDINLSDSKEDADRIMFPAL